MKNFEVDIHIMNCRVLIQYRYKNKVNLQHAEIFLNKRVRNTCKQQLPATEIHLAAGTVKFELKLWTGKNLALSRMTAALQIQILTPEDFTNLERHSKLSCRNSLHVLLKELIIYLTDKTFKTIINSVYWRRLFSILFQEDISTAQIQIRFFWTHEILFPGDGWWPSQ